MSKHTPGPWEFDGISDFDEERGSAFIVGSNLGGLVGAALPWPTELDSGDFSRVESNARLISAAPDLLDACKAMMRHHGMMSHEGVKMCGDAIAKAEGQR